MHPTTYTIAADILQKEGIYKKPRSMISS